MVFTTYKIDVGHFFGLTTLLLLMIGFLLLILIDDRIFDGWLLIIIDDWFLIIGWLILDYCLLVIDFRVWWLTIDYWLTYYWSLDIDHWWTFVAFFPTNAAYLLHFGTTVFCRAFKASPPARGRDGSVLHTSQICSIQCWKKHPQKYKNNISLKSIGGFV